MLTVIQPHYVCPRSQRVCFPSLHCSDSRLLCRELSDAGPGLHVLPRSSCSGSGSPQRCRLGWACVLHPSQVQAAEVTRCFGEHSGPQLKAVAYPRPCSRHSVFWVYNGCAFSGVLCVYSGELVSGCDPPGECQSSRIPRSLG